MKRYLPIFASLSFVLGLFFYVQNLKNSQKEVASKTVELGEFSKQRSCARHPNFLKKANVRQPVAIDLSQKRYKGLAFLHGRGLSRALHLKTWERFAYFSTYDLDPKGNMYLTPMPFISVDKNTFELQKNIYRLDSNSGNLEIWKTLDEVKAGGNNPFGVIALEYDCDDHTLWVSAIDETDYRHNRGVIYHIDIKTKKVLQEVKEVEALSLKLLKTSKGKYLLFGNARKNTLDGLEILKDRLSEKPFTLLTLPLEQEHIRKIKIKGHNLLELQTIPFSYTLIAETSSGDDRNYYSVEYNKETHLYKIMLKKYIKLH